MGLAVGRNGLANDGDGGGEHHGFVVAGEGTRRQETHGQDGGEDYVAAEGLHGGLHQGKALNLGAHCDPTPEPALNGPFIRGLEVEKKNPSTEAGAERWTEGSFAGDQAVRLEGV